MTHTPLDRFVHRVTTLIALTSGLTLAAVALMTTASIIGRALIAVGLGPVPGDFELVEIGTAVAVFGLLPYCHLHRGHVTVDILVSKLPTPIFNALTFSGDLTIAVITVIVAWRLWFGFQEKLAYGESTMILGAPLWYGYALCFVAAVWACVVVTYVLWRDLRAIRAAERLA